MENRIEINSQKIRRNLASIRRYTRNAPILAMVKANAYGMGLERIARILAGGGVTSFGVWGADEALTLRSLNDTWTIVNFSPLTLGGVRQTFSDNISPVIATAHDIQILRGGQRYASRPLQAFLKVNTGLQRWGLNLIEVGGVARQIIAMGGISICALITTLSESVKDVSAIQSLTKVQQELAAKGIHIPYVSFASSHGILTLPRTNFGLIRPGIMLFGIYPDAQTERKKSVRLEAAWKLVSYVTQLRTLSARTPIGYKQSYVTKIPLVIAILPIGYANGYNIGNQGRTYVLIEGKRCPVLSVSMTATVVDISPVDRPKIGQEVVLVGSQKNNTISLSELTQKTGGSPYTFMATLPNNIARTYI